MCDQCPYIECEHRNMMSVLGESHLPGYPDPLRGGLFGSSPYGPGIGLGHGSILPVPLWRPTATHATAMWCTSATCPCNLTRSPYLMNDILDFYSSVTPSNPWRPWYPKHSGDSVYKRNSPHESRESPSKELPTKILKHERVKDRQELSQTLNFDREHLLKLRSRCTGTQTQISHVEHEMFMNGERHAASLESYSMRAHHPLLPPPPPQTSQSIRDPRGSPPKYTPMDTHDTPLNLSLSSTSSPPSSSAFCSQVSRPSVITCAPTIVERVHRYGNTASPPPTLSSAPQHALLSPGRREIISDGCNPDIEEHFRRSLGRDYMAPKTSPKTAQLPPTQLPPPPPLPQQPVCLPVKATSPQAMVTAPSAPTATKSNKSNSTNVSITGSVDDHFAKSLGRNTWSAIKAQNDPMQELKATSVDDHFAKALGDTWLRIKAEKEIHPSHANTNGSSSPPSSPQQQRHDSSLLST